MGASDTCSQGASRDAAMVAAWLTGAYSYTDIGRHFGVHFTTVGRIVRAARAVVVK